MWCVDDCVVRESSTVYTNSYSFTRTEKQQKQIYDFEATTYLSWTFFCGNNNLCLSQKKKKTYVSMESPLKDMNKQMRHCVSTKKTNATLKKLTSLFSGGIEKIHVMSEIFGSL